jgi:hypothetical protein
MSCTFSPAVDKVVFISSILRGVYGSHGLLYHQHCLLCNISTSYYLSRTWTLAYRWLPSPFHCCGSPCYPRCCELCIAITALSYLLFAADIFVAFLPAVLYVLDRHGISWTSSVPCAAVFSCRVCICLPERNMLVRVCLFCCACWYARFRPSLLPYDAAVDNHCCIYRLFWNLLTVTF